MKKIHPRDFPELLGRQWALVVVVCLSAVSLPAGEIITDYLTVLTEADFYGDVNIQSPQGNAPTNALSLYYSFDTNESGIVTDLSGNGNTEQSPEPLDVRWASEWRIHG